MTTSDDCTHGITLTHVAVTCAECKARLPNLPDEAPALRAENVRLRAALAEARAAMTEVLDEYPTYEELDPLRRVLGLPLYDSPEAWTARGAALSHQGEPTAEPERTAE